MSRSCPAGPTAAGTTTRCSRLVFATLVTHYWSHGCFFADGEVLAGMHRVASIPGVLVHGRYDVSSPLGTAWQLHRAWPARRLVVIDDAGHGGGSFATEIVSAQRDEGPFLTVLASEHVPGDQGSPCLGPAPPSTMAMTGAVRSAFGFVPAGERCVKPFLLFGKQRSPKVTNGQMEFVTTPRSVSAGAARGRTYGGAPMWRHG